MKTFFFLLISIFLLQSCSKCQLIVNGEGIPVKINYIKCSDPRVKYVDILIGQSNTNGHENVVRLTGPLAYLADTMKLNGKYAYIKNYWYDSSDFNPIKAGVNTSQEVGRLGIQPRLAYNLLNYQLKDYYFIQSAGNGYPIFRWNDSMPLMEYAYRQWIAFKNQAIAEGKIPRVRSVIFIQGEADAALYQTLSGTYKKELQNLAYRMRLRFDPNLVFIIGQALANSECAGGATVANLMEMQRQVSLEPGNALVPYEVGDDMFDGPPKCHYNQATYNRKADLIFNIIKDL